MNKQIFLTQQGLDELRREHDELVKLKRPQVVNRLSTARDMGDLSENAEYTAARDELAFIDSRIEELEELLKKATLIKEKASTKKNNKIGLGSSVTVSSGNKKDTFTLVGEWESDPEEKKISNESPLGKALMGRGEGESFEISVPAGKMTYKIVKIN